MLGKRITEARKYISLYDPALQEATAMQAARYRLNRDISELEGWEAWTVQPTVFTIRPLEAGYGHLADRMSFMDRRSLFMLFVDAAENMTPEPKWETVNGQHSMVSDSLDAFGDEVIDEIAEFIKEAAYTDTTGFTLPASYQEYLRGTNARRAILPAPSDTPAKEKSSS